MVQKNYPRSLSKQGEELETAIPEFHIHSISFEVFFSQMYAVQWPCKDNKEKFSSCGEKKILCFELKTMSVFLIALKAIWQITLKHYLNCSCIHLNYLSRIALSGTGGYRILTEEEFSKYVLYWSLCLEDIKAYDNSDCSGQNFAVGGLLWILMCSINTAWVEQ